MAEQSPQVSIQQDGPYSVSGPVPLRRKTPLASERGERLAWRTGDVINDGDYTLCRCGGSSNKPYCDNTHREGFDGTETAPTDAYAERSKRYEGTGVDVHDDRGICSHASFCATKSSNVWKMTRRSEDTDVRSQMMAMIERCPSGALTYDVDGETVEPHLPAGISVMPNGPLLVTGGVPVARADGELMETRNRVALCRCGHSSHKPLCDGTHREVGFRG